MKKTIKFLLLLIIAELIILITFTTLSIKNNLEIKKIINNYIKEIEKNIPENTKKIDVSDIEIDLDKKPTEGWMRIENGKIVEYSLKYKEYIIDLEKDNIIITRDNKLRIIPEIIIKIGEDNIISTDDEIILKYDKEEYKFNVIETNEETTTLLGQDIIKENIDDYIKNLQEKGFKSITGGIISEEKPIIYIKTENLK